jgi:hypothetical protein
MKELGEIESVSIATKLFDVDYKLKIIERMEEFIDFFFWEKGENEM